jgi:hypothetical protein
MRDLRQAVHGRAIIMEKRVYKHQILKKLIFFKKKQHDLDVRSTLPANCYRGCLERCLRFENRTRSLKTLCLYERERERERERDWHLGGGEDKLVSLSKKRVHAEEVNG